MTKIIKIMIIAVNIFMVSDRGFSQDKQSDNKDDSGSEIILLYVEGNVKVREKDTQEWKDVDKDTVLSNGAQIKLEKDSYAEVNLDENKTIELNEETLIDMPNGATKTSLELFYGSLKAKVKKLSGAHMEIKTPVAVAAVRGTEFAVIHEESGAAELDVYDGEVSFQNMINDIPQEITVTKDQWAKADLNSKPEIGGKINQARQLRWKHFRGKKEIFLNRRSLRKNELKLKRLKKQHNFIEDSEKKKALKDSIKKLEKEIKKVKNNIDDNSKALKDTAGSYNAIRKKKAEARKAFMTGRKEKMNKIRLEKLNKTKQRRKDIKDKFKKKMDRKRENRKKRKGR